MPSQKLADALHRAEQHTSFRIAYAWSACAVMLWVAAFGPKWLLLASIPFWLGVVALRVHLDKLKPLDEPERLKALHLVHEYQPDNADWCPRSLH